MESLKSGGRSQWWWLGLTLLAACSANNADLPSTTNASTVSSSIPVVDWLPSDAGGPPKGSDITELERVELVAACLREYGLEAYGPDQFEENGDVFFGGPAVIIEVPEDQSGYSESAYATCSNVISAWYPQQVRSLEEQYRHKVKMARCLQELGYPAEDPPTLEAWIESVNDSSSSPWDPYTLILDMLSMADAEAVRVQCEGE